MKYVSHPLTQPPTHLQTWLFTHSQTRSLSHSFIHRLAHSLTHRLTHSDSLIHRLTHSHSINHSHLRTNSLTHSLTDSLSPSQSLTLLFSHSQSHSHLKNPLFCSHSCFTQFVFLWYVVMILLQKSMYEICLSTCDDGQDGHDLFVNEPAMAGDRYVKKTSKGDENSINEHIHLPRVYEKLLNSV